MFPPMPLEANGLQALVRRRVTGTRASLERTLSLRKSLARTMARIWLLNASVLVHSQYLFQHSRYCGPAQFSGLDPSGGDGNLLEWQRAHRSENTTLPRVTVA